MNTKLKIVTLLFVVFCVTTPFLVNASAGSQPPNLLASISSIFQGIFTSIYSIFSGGVVPSTSVQNKAVIDSITLQLGDKSVMVDVLQQALIAEGYLKPPATGVFDENTQAAVEAFQKAKGLPVTGYIKMATSSLASSFSAASSSFTPITVGATGTRATAFQKFFIAKGDLKIATTTTYFGTQTEAAVKAFQASHGLPQTGKIDQATFAAMNGR
jgi:peptidoglycan hydrolase-like protein with peptidoglycan-binding domain